MNLVMLDIDGTLIQSYEYDREVFGKVIGEVLGCPPVDADLNGYIHKTSLGVTEEAVRRVTGREVERGEVEEVKRKVLHRFEAMHKETPHLFSEVPGARNFLERLSKQDDTGTAIATGCWLEEAWLKTSSSGLSIEGIPTASSNDDRDRMKIMVLAEEKARLATGCPNFKRIVYVGDGAWDLQMSRRLGYGFIGIGPRVEAYQASEGIRWHADFTDLGAVFGSIAAELKGE